MPVGGPRGDHLRRALQPLGPAPLLRMRSSSHCVFGELEVLVLQMVSKIEVSRYHDNALIWVLRGPLELALNSILNSPRHRNGDVEVVDVPMDKNFAPTLLTHVLVEGRSNTKNPPR